MTPLQIDYIKTSWAAVLPISNVAAELFYGKLFELDPDLKPLFRGDINGFYDASDEYTRGGDERDNESNQDGCIHDQMLMI